MIKHWTVLLALAASLTLAAALPCPAPAYSGPPPTPEHEYKLIFPLVLASRPQYHDVEICGTVSTGDWPDHPVVVLWFQWHDDPETGDVITEVPVGDDGSYCLTEQPHPPGWIFMVNVEGVTHSRYEVLRWPTGCWLEHFTDRIYCQADRPACYHGLDWEATR